MKALILAAGIGQRLKSNLPKILLKVGKKSLLERHYENLIELNVKNIGIVIGYKSQVIKKYINKGRDQVEEGLPGWFGTFADMMTLLFAFFVLLAAISTMDPVKLQEMANSEGKSLGSKIKKEGNVILAAMDNTLYIPVKTNLSRNDNIPLSEI